MNIYFVNYVVVSVIVQYMYLIYDSGLIENVLDGILESKSLIFIEK